MGRAPCCPREGLKRGTWTSEEDQILISYIQAHGPRRWSSVPKEAGLNRSGKSCRLRWLNYLRPGLKRGDISIDEEDLIIRLHKLLGNRWSLIAGRLPGRTDNEIKNYWNSTLKKKVMQHNGLNLRPSQVQTCDQARHESRVVGALLDSQLDDGILKSKENEVGDSFTSLDSLPVFDEASGGEDRFCWEFDESLSSYMSLEDEFS